MSCRYLPPVTDDEVGATRWLVATLQRVVERGGENAQRAANAIKMLAGMADHARKMHEIAHDQDATIAKLHEALEQLERRCETLDLLVNDLLPRCSQCMGSRWVEANGGDIPCPRCNGSGKEDRP